jgi:dihydrofolate synthase / folylpolyglutamate synthase
MAGNGVPSTPAEALAFLHQRSPSTVVLGLERMQAALAELGHPERRLPAIHVAGTNGKGSTCALVEAVLRAAGFRVGLYTSPHLVRFNERIRIGGADIENPVLGQRLLEVLQRSPTALALTYFELGTLVAFWHFAEEQVEWGVLETGLGGRLDATATCLPRATAITALGLDHTELLGPTLAAIAREKAGILRPGVPAVLAGQPPEAMEVLLSEAARVGAPVLRQGVDFDLQREGGAGLTWHHGVRRLGGLRLGLAGDHQRQNGALALALLDVLSAGGAAIPDAAIVRGLADVRWPGRLEEVPGRPLLLLDGAHNPAGVEALRAELDGAYAGRRIHLVFGAVREKEVGPMLARLLPRMASVHLTPLDTPRSLPPESYLAAAQALVPDSAALGSPGAALEAAMAGARPEDVVLVAGSLYLIGAVKAHLAGAEIPGRTRG